MALTLRAGVSTADTDYGTTLLDENSGEYWNLNPSGALVLRTLLDGGTPEEAAAALAAEFEVGDRAASEDVRELVDGLRSARLIEDDRRGAR
jgi:Coenzyme PQQ synthesis protein D (PqqD)